MIVKKERKYKGFWTDGHDNGELNYYSYYRNCSKKNMEDMKTTYIKKYGSSEYKHKKFSFGYLLED